LNPLDLTDCDLVLSPVLKFGGPGRFTRSHLLGMLEPASILQVNRHTGRPPGVTPDRRQKPRVLGPRANRRPDQAQGHLLALCRCPDPAENRSPWLFP